MKMAVLALQGAFIEHEQMLQRLGVETVEIRQLKDWQQPIDALILHPPWWREYRSDAPVEGTRLIRTYS